MNILCATDRNFLNPTYVTVNSIIANHKRTKINFFILLNQDVTQEDKDKLYDFIDSKGHNCVFYDVKDDAFKDYVVCERFPKSAYYRLLAHTFLPENVHRILYLDVDIVVDKNIYDDFYSLDFGDKYLVVTSHNPDPNFFNELDDTLVNFESAARGEFFNSGVLLMNIDKFREENISLYDYDQAYQYCVSHDIKVFYDQGLLNFMFFDKSIYLSSMDYNFRYSIPRDYKNRLDPNREYKKAIIHYTGMKQPYKPWDLRLTEEDIEPFGGVPYSQDYFFLAKDLNELCEIWWKYAETVPVYDQIQHDAAVKTKWFRRNILEFAIKHNRLVKDSENQKKTIKDLSNKAPKQVVKETIVRDYPVGFKRRLYKIAVIVSKPLFVLRDGLRKLKK